MHTRVRTMLFALLCGSTPLFAQNEKIPERPKMVADSNDALEYLMVGAKLLEKSPRDAAAAFYWSMRLDPDNPHAYYGRRVALMLDMGSGLERYMEADARRAKSKEFRRLDSLQYRALSLNPFFFRRFDRLVFEQYMKSIYAHEMARQGMQPNYAEMMYWLRAYMTQAGPDVRAWEAYTGGRFDDAVRLYALAIKGSSKDGRYINYADRARAFFLMGRSDSAEVSMKLALEDLRKLDEKKLVYFYESKAVYEHSIALTHEARNQYDAAREAYGRALQEDISYFPAHVGTARVALLTGDTAGAIAAYDLAVQIKPDDAVVRTSYGQVLNVAGRFADAEKQLRTAIELEPYFATSYGYLGDALMGLNRAADAVVQYREFLNRAARSDQRRSGVEAMLRRAQAQATSASQQQ